MAKSVTTPQTTEFHKQVNAVVSQLLLPNDTFMALHLDPYDYDSVKTESSASEFTIQAYRKGKLAAQLKLTAGKNATTVMVIEHFNK